MERGSLLLRSAEQTLHGVWLAPWRIRRLPCGSLQASSPNNFGPGSCRTFSLSRFLVYLCLPSLQACSSLLLLSCPRTCAAACLPPFLSDLQLQLLIHVWFLSEKNIHPECLTHCLQSISAAPQRFSEYPSSLQRTACSECDPQQTARQQPPLPRTRVCHMSCSVLAVTVPLPFPRRARWTGITRAGCQWITSALYEDTQCVSLQTLPAGPQLAKIQQQTNPDCFADTAGPSEVSGLNSSYLSAITLVQEMHHPVQFFSRASRTSSGHKFPT